MQLDDQATGLDFAARNGLRRNRSRAIGTLIAGFALVAITIGFAVAAGDRAASVHRAGVKVGGVVTATCRCGGSPTVSATYRWQHNRFDGTFGVPDVGPQYRPGAPVTIFVERDTNRTYLLGEPRLTVGMIVALVVLGTASVLLTVAGVWLLVQTRRQRLVLETHDWVRIPATWIRERRVRLGASRIGRSAELDVAGAGWVVVRSPEAPRVLVSARMTKRGATDYFARTAS